ncbi:MAG: PQQ-binding-like beta-propeller repeat protein [Candidatus Aenigmarchaeota archaeon]|nr:PQQ-binding-like beta-propeller repeat protein [Candidatus Aenigmarchaeota archaeon]
MDFDFGGFDSGFDNFEAEIEDFQLVKIKKMDRHLRGGEGGSILATPMLNNGMVYFTSADHYVYAVDVETGEEKWRFRTDGKMFCTPAVYGNLVIVGAYDRNVYAINENGEEVWRFQTGGEIASSPFVNDGMVFIGSNDGYMYCINAETGEEKWRFRTGDWIGSSPAVWNERLYFGSYDGYIYCLSLGGKEFWRFKMGAEIWALHESPSVWEGVVYFASMDGYLYAIDAYTGREVWKVKTGKYGNAIQPFVNDEFVLQPSRDGILFAFGRDGKEKWRFDLGNLPAGTVVHGDRIYLGNESGYFRCLNLEGKEIWGFQTGNKIFGGPLFYKDMIIFGSYDCHLYSVSLSGEEKWRFTTSNQQPIELPPAHDAFRLEVKKEQTIDETFEEDKYKSKKEASASLSDYKIESEYASTSDYKAKSDYDVSVVVFEELFEGESLWTSHSEVLIQASKTSTLNSRISR